jgi:hypothetical protein
MEAIYTNLLQKGRPLSSFKKGDLIHVDDKMQSAYSYHLDEEPGTNLAFTPYTDPGEILALGAFDGKYLNDCYLEFPAEWFLRAGALGKLSPDGPRIDMNYFKITSRLPLSSWRASGWAPPMKGQRRHISKQHPLLSDPHQNPDVRGWFQWYCRYWMGRRLPSIDEIQIKRWRAFNRHAGAIKANCTPGEVTCRSKQRQALLQWAYNPFI